MNVLNKKVNIQVLTEKFNSDSICYTRKSGFEKY